MEICREKLLNGLENIVLLSSNIKQTYGALSVGHILIFMSTPFHQLQPEQFKKHIAKPYLFLVIVHELTHLLLRSFTELKPIKGSSFDDRFRKDGLSLKKFAVNVFSNITQYFTLKQHCNLNTTQKIQQLKDLEENLK